MIYEKYRMDVIRFDNADAFVGCILELSGDENGEGVGPASINPGVSDS